MTRNGIILVNVILSIIFIWSFARLAPTIHHQFFPHISKADNQTYMLGLALFLLFQTLLYPLIKTHVYNYSHAAKRSLLFILLCLDVAALVMAYISSLIVIQSPGIQESLKRIGIYVAEKLTLWNFLLGECVALSITLLLLTKINWTLPKKTIWHIFATIIILLLMLGLGNINLYDYTNIAGPINDLILGKPLFTYRASYGSLPIVLLSLIFHFIPLTSEALHVEIAVIDAIGFLLLYVLLNRIYKDPRWALITIVSAIFVQHLAAAGIRSTYQYPQASVLRLGMWIFVALALNFKDWLTIKLGRVGVHVPAIAVSISFLWTPDFGLYTLLSYILFLFLVNLDRQLVVTIKHFILELLILVTDLSIVFFSINAIYVVWYRSFPMWTTYYFSSYIAYQKYDYMLPVPNAPALWIYILVCIVTISLLIYTKKEKGKLDNAHVSVLFTACIGLVTFNYFLGRSYLISLVVLSLPFFVCLFYQIQFVISECSKISKAATLSAGVFMASVLCVPATLYAYQGLETLTLSNPYNTVRVLTHTMPGVTDEQYWVGPTAQGLRNKYGNEITSGNLTMLSMWDTWFLIIYHTTNRAGLNCLICYYFPADDLSFIIENIHKSPSQYLFVDSNRKLENGRVEYLLSKLKDKYQYVETIGFIDVFKRT